MKVLFRCDGSTAMGLGHIFRCISLAKNLLRQNVQCLFVLRTHEQKSYYEPIMGSIPTVYLDSEVTPVPDDMNNPEAIKETWLGVSEEKELNDLTSIMLDHRPNILVIDHYSYNNSLTSALNIFAPLAVVDDLNNRLMQCDIIINHNLGFIKGHYKNCYNKNGDVPKLLLGPEYCMIENSFSTLETSRTFDEDKKLKLLVTFGALDHNNMSLSVLNAIAKSKLSALLDVSVMLHANAPHRNELEKWSSEALPSLKFYWSPEDIPRLYKNASLALGAGGTSAWERCASGLPSLMIPAADNQAKIIDFISEAGGGMKASLTIGENDFFLSLLEEITTNKFLLNQMSYNSRKIVDGHGIDRISCEFLNYAN
jgi:UDP-2,4-diacetamido-2,4,6-trideoxy-beta-L-altropyranose hydrolase